MDFETSLPEGIPDNTAVEAPAPPIKLEDAKKKFREAMTATMDNDVLCQRDARFYHGAQITSEERAKLQKRGQPEIYINRLAPALNGILGIFDAGETDPMAYPRNPDQQDAADVVTKLLRYLGDKARIKEVRRVLSENYFLQGTCAVIVGDGAKQGDKSLKVTPILWADFFADPLSRYHDFQDARYLGIVKWFDADTIEAMYPEQYRALGDPFDGSFDVFATKNDIEERLRWVDTNRRRLRVIEMYFVDGAGKWSRVVFCERGFLDFGDSAYTDDEGQTICPIIASSYALRPDTGDRYGALRHAVDPQREINSRRSKLLQLTNSRQVQITHEGADPKKIELAREQASRPDGVLPFGYESRSLPDMAEGQMLILQESQKDIDRMAPTPATLGQLQSGDSGRAREILQNAGMTEWSRAFARLEVLEEQIYRHLWFGARQFLTDQMFIRVTGDMRTPQFLQINTPVMGMVPQPVTGQDGQPVVDPHTGQPAMQMGQGIVRKEQDIAQMDCDITLGTIPSTPTLEMEVWTELLRYSASMQVSVASPEFKFLIMASPLPNRTSVLERIEAIQEKATQEQAAQAQAAQEDAMLKAQHTQARSIKDMAMAHKLTAEAARTEVETYEIKMGQAIMGIGPHAPIPADANLSDPLPQPPTIQQPQQPPMAPPNPMAPPTGQ